MKSLLVDINRSLKSPKLILVIPLLLALQSCSDKGNSNYGASLLETHGPVRLMESKAVNQDELFATLTIDGKSTTLAESGGIWSGEVTVDKNKTYTIAIDWFENFGDQSLHLAEAKQTVSVGEVATSISIPDSLYQTENLDTDNDRISNIAEREDGTDPLNDTSWKRYLLTRINTDGGADGTIDCSHEFTYSAIGQLESKLADGISLWSEDNYWTRSECSNGIDGGIDAAEYYVFNTEWDLVSIKRDLDNNGSIDFVRNFSYDNDGNLIAIEDDRGANGVTDQRTTFTYDNDGLLTSKEVVSADGSNDETTSYTYNGSGKLISVTYDTDSNGTIDKRRWHYYDSEGNRTSTEEDVGNDGSIDEIDRYSYDANGNMITEEDYDGDGVIQNIETYTYDSRGNLIRHQDDYSADGSINYRTTFIYDEVEGADL